MPSLEKIDEEIVETIKVFKDQLNLQCMRLATDLQSSANAECNSSILPTPIWHGGCSPATTTGTTHPRSIYRQLERRRRRLAVGQYHHPGEAARCILPQYSTGWEPGRDALLEPVDRWISAPVHSACQGCRLQNHAHRSVSGRSFQSAAGRV